MMNLSHLSIILILTLINPLIAKINGDSSIKCICTGNSPDWCKGGSKTDCEARDWCTWNCTSPIKAVPISSSCCPSPATACDTDCCENMSGNVETCLAQCSNPPSKYSQWKQCVKAVGCDTDCCESATGSFEKCMNQPCCNTIAPLIATPINPKAYIVNGTNATIELLVNESIVLECTRYGTGSGPTINQVVIMESVDLGTVTGYEVDLWNLEDGAWINVASGNSIGHKLTIPIGAGIAAEQARLTITAVASGGVKSVAIQSFAVFTFDPSTTSSDVAVASDCGDLGSTFFNCGHWNGSNKYCCDGRYSESLKSMCSHPSIEEACHEIVSVSVSSSPTPTTIGTCQCEAGDFWCSTQDILRTNFNCSGSKKTIHLYNAISNVDQPTRKECELMEQECIMMPKPAENGTCDNSCFDFCWKTDVGDCADDDDSQILCVSNCQQWCVANRCNQPTPFTNSECYRKCSKKSMEVDDDDINFIDFSNCVNECTTTPVGPY